MKNLAIIAIAFLLIQCEPVVPQQSSVNKKVVFDNYEYESIVGNVQLLPIENGQINEIGNPVTRLVSGDLFLTFDLLTDQFENLSLKLFHCDKDWKKSKLRDMEYLNEINNYRITEFEYSVNTVQPYIKYSITVPKPRISGNYTLAIHRRANSGDILLTRRFMVVENIASIDQTVRVSTVIANRDVYHQIEYNVTYGDLLVNSPSREITTTILQNHNWNSAKTNIPPTLIRPNEGYIEYQHLDNTTNFLGWNEFRFTDLRTLNMAGRNVGRITNTGTKILAALLMDKTRGNITYTLNFQDINGNFLIQNNDPGESIPNADYAEATFSLQSDKIAGDVYVYGQFNNWKLNDINRMKFTNSNGVNRYTTTIPLKQGYYEYLYYVDGQNISPYHFEGSHFQALNDYEIFVYYRKPGEINDRIVGYKKFGSIQ